MRVEAAATCTGFHSPAARVSCVDAMTTTNPDATPAPAASAPLFNRNMTLVCLGQSLGYGASAFLAPLLPLYLVSQGHAEGFIGLVLAACLAGSCEL